MSNFKKDQTKTVLQPAISFQVTDPVVNEKCTILHCRYKSARRIRIWPTTFLVQKEGNRKKLLHAFNIAIYPQWTTVLPGHCFTLVFESLDKDCDLFNFHEDIPEPGGWFVPDIIRNEQDVYWVELH